jgi:sortase A
MMKKKRMMRYSKQRVFKRRRRIAFFIFIGLLAALLVLGGLRAYLFSGTSGGTSDTLLDQVDTPTVGDAPDPIAEETAAKKKKEAEEKAAREEAEEAAAPNDPTLYLTVPRLGIYGHTVRNDRSEAALDLGAAKLPDTSFPWQKGDTNTYIACHRLGWPGLESYHQCLNLPSMQKGDELYLTDANGKVYEYRVSEFLQVSPDDTWVTKPEAGRKILSLQTCIESPNDFVTLGPNWTVRFIVRADRVA